MKALITEDNPLLGKSIKQGLEEAGWTVDLAKDGDEGAYYIDSCQYDVIVLDWMLPQRSGLELLKELRKNGREDPVIMVTAKGTVVDRVDGLNHGADDYLVKPFEMVELLARVNALCRRRVSQGAKEVVIADLKVDVLGQRAWNRTEQIEMTTKEFDLLVALVTRTDQLVKRSDLSNSLYELDSEPDSNSLDVLLARVRKKIAGSGVNIETVRGKGFVLRSSADKS